MLKIAEWGRNKPVLPAVLAQFIAITPNTLHRYLSRVRNFKDIRNISQPKSKLWLFFYLKTKHIQAEINQKLVDLFVIDDQLIKEIKELAPKINNFLIDQKIITQDQLKFAKSSSRTPILTIEQKLNDHIQTKLFWEALSNLSSEFHPISSLIYNYVIKLIESDIEDENNGLTSSEDNDLKIFTPEIIFFLKITFPCWILYAENHTILLRKARQGNIESLEKMLRLDKTLTRDRLINEQITKSISEDPIKFDYITKAIRSKPKEQNTLPRIKTSLAGLISVLSEELGHRFTAPQIKELFDAVAIDYSIDELIDTDLPDSPEALSKAIQRERPFWQKFIK